MLLAVEVASRHWCYEDGTKNSQLAHLSQVELLNHGDFSGLASRETKGNSDLMFFVWTDGEHRYVIASASNLQIGDIYVRRRWWQVNEEDNAEPDNVKLEIPQSKVCQIYYDVCGEFDNHNRHRQSTLQVDNKFKHMIDPRGTNLIILLMVIVDIWLAYKHCTCTAPIQKDFNSDIAEGLLDNKFNFVWLKTITKKF